MEVIDVANLREILITAGREGEDVDGARVNMMMAKEKWEPSKDSKFSKIVRC